MEEITIPGWFIWIISAFITLFIPWAIWITTKVFESEKEIALNTANDEKVNEDLQRIYDIIDESNKTTKERFDKIESKIDQFFNQEINLLKQLVVRQ